MKMVFIGTEPRTAEMITLTVRLRWPDCIPVVTTTAVEGIERIEIESPELVIMQPTFSDMTLSQTITEMRRFSNVPLMVLSNQGDETEVVSALESGADDYVRMPCSFMEIVARLFALIRRVNLSAPHGSEQPIVSGELLINPATYEVYIGKQRVSVTATEFRLLFLLVKNRGTVMTHQVLERAIWGDNVDSTALVKKYIQRLRHKLMDNPQQPHWLASVHGVGYRFIGPPLASPFAESQHAEVMA